MNTVKVQYTVKESYVETNKANIQKVMAALREKGSAGLKYSAFLLDDGQTFVHFAIRENEEAQKLLSELPEFQAFQKALRESGPLSPPQPKNLTMVGSSYAVFED